VIHQWTALIIDFALIPNYFSHLLFSQLDYLTLLQNYRERSIITELYCFLHAHCVPKSSKPMYTKVISITLLFLYWFSKLFCCTLCEKFAIKLSLKIPSHLKRVVTSLVKLECCELACFVRAEP